MEIKIESLDTIHEAAKLFINNIGNNKVFAFYGKMGVGKTTFTKAICEVLGVQDVIIPMEMATLFITSISIALKS